MLLVARFDRDAGHRVPYLSARTLIGGRDGASHDYLELVDALTAHGSDVNADLDELWRRIALSVALNNVDDHMRNHAVLGGPGGWALSPVFDVNPDARPNAPSASSIAGATTPAERLEALVASADRFGLTHTEAQQRWDTTLDAVAAWRTTASRHGIPPDAQDSFAPVLDRWAGPARDLPC